MVQEPFQLSTLGACASWSWALKADQVALTQKPLGCPISGRTTFWPRYIPVIIFSSTSLSRYIEGHNPPNRNAPLLFFAIQLIATFMKSVTWSLIWIVVASIFKLLPLTYSNIITFSQRSVLIVETLSTLPWLLCWYQERVSAIAEKYTGIFIFQLRNSKTNHSVTSLVGIDDRLRTSDEYISYLTG